VGFGSRNPGIVGDKEMPKKKKTNKRPDRSSDMATSKLALSVTDPEVQQEFREMSRFRTGRGRISEGEDLSGGEVDTAREGREEEVVGGSAALSDQDIVENIGRAAGLTYQDNEELDPAEKVRKRDRKRWERQPFLIRGLPGTQLAEEMR
jgi:hypothetical protein